MDNIERALRMEIATKQLQIDTLKRKIKEMEDDYNNRLRDIENRKKNKGIKPSDNSNK